MGQITRDDKEAAAAAATMTDGSTSGGVKGTAVGNVGEANDEEDAEMGEALTVPLEEAFMSRTEEGEVSVEQGGGIGFVKSVCVDILRWLAVELMLIFFFSLRS